MAGKSLINGTLYSISGGTTMVNGTVCDIVSGKSLIDGTVYTISFSKVNPIIYALGNTSINNGEITEGTPIINANGFYLQAYDPVTIENIDSSGYQYVRLKFDSPVEGFSVDFYAIDDSYINGAWLPTGRTELIINCQLKGKLSKIVFIPQSGTYRITDIYLSNG